MKLEAAAGALSSALSAAELALDNRPMIEALAMVRVVAEGEHATFIADALDRRVAASVPVSVIETGEALARCVSLAGVLAKLRPEQAVRLARNENNVVIAAGRSRFKIPGISFDLLPQSTAPADAATVEFSLATKDMLRLIEATRYAASNEETRYYLNGIYFHIADSAETSTLRSVATDGARLAQIDLPLPAGAEKMPGIIVPNKTTDTIVKLLRRKGVAENVTLQVSERLLKLSLPDLQLTSKLIDATYPDYARVVPNGYSCSVTTDRNELMTAIARVKATVNPEVKGIKHTAAFAWDAGVLHVYRPEQDADVDDVIDAETDGVGKVTLQIAFAEDALNALPDKRVIIAVNGPGTPVRFTGPSDPSMFGIIMPVWGDRPLS